MAWTSRYASPEIESLFSDKGRHVFQIMVEREWLAALREERLYQKCDLSQMPKLERVKEIEKQTRHDIVALVKAIEETISDSSVARFTHFGLTSQDVNDTVLALQLSKAHQKLMVQADYIRIALAKFITTNRDVLCVARTHGQHAIPITMGWKFANFLHDWVNAAMTVTNFSRMSIFGKLSGAVGTGAALESVNIDSEGIQNRVLSRLGLRPTMITTQTISRTYMVQYLSLIVTMVCHLEKIAKEIRNLSRSEIGEVYEDFSSEQVGSSAMPQKRNPIQAENISGIVRVIRAQLGPLLETISLEHERDLTNSSVERIEIPTILGLSHFVMKRMYGILSRLRVDPKRCLKNLNMSNGRVMSENVMTHLILDKEMSRYQAHEFLGRNQELNFKKHISEYFSEEEVDELLNYRNYLGRINIVVDRIMAQMGKLPTKETTNDDSDDDET